jgi:hypothetical protein
MPAKCPNDNAWIPKKKPKPANDSDAGEYMIFCTTYLFSYRSLENLDNEFLSHIFSQQRRKISEKTVYF